MKNRMDVFEAWSTRIGFLALDPIDHFRGGKDAGLDAAMAFLDRGFADEFLRRRSFEVGFDFGFQGRLIAFQRQQEIGLVLDDLGGDLDTPSRRW